MTGFYLYNNHVVAIYAPFLVIAAFVFFARLIMYLKKRDSIMPTIMGFCIMGWLGCEMAVFVLENADTNMFVWNALLVFPAFLFPTQFLFVYGFYHDVKKIPIHIKCLLFVIPIISAVIMLTPLYPLARTAEIVTLSFLSATLYPHGTHGFGCKPGMHTCWVWLLL
ncbi:MAG: hypothetical protein FWC97_11780 [Treponema sp.]|nr:hypothetical protein [Treponema sp.]